MVLAVVLDNNVWTFSPGQTINGNVVVTKNIWHKIEGLSIRIIGKMEFGSAASAPAQPPEDTLPNYQQDRSLFDRLTRCRPVQTVMLDHKMNLLLSWKVLKPGSHEFPFSYTLPDEDDLPDSIKIDGFRILYEFVVVLRRPRDDYKIYQTPFYVQTKLSESEISRSETISKYLNDIALKTEDSIGYCLCCLSGSYGFQFRVPRRIAHVGKDVDFILEIWNKTRIPMDCAKILLIREFKHKKGFETRKREAVSELSGPTVSAGGHEVWATFFRIPANTQQTNFVRRDTYEINYYLKAVVHPVNRANKKISVKCPLLVLLAEDEVINVHNIVHSPIGSNDMNVEPTVYGVPPPTYEDAITGNDNSSTGPLLE